MNYRNLTLSSLFLVAMMLAIWTTFLNYRPIKITVQHQAILPDAYMDDVTALILDKLGKPKLKIVTPKMIHYNNQDITNLIDPELTIYRQSPQPWSVTAKFARAFDGIEKVNFWDNVIIHHPPDGNNPDTLINTTKLSVFPNKQTAQTDAFIKLTQPNITMTAIGLRADMNTGNIKLLSQARGEYIAD